MGYSIDEQSGFVIKVDSLLSNHPTALRRVKALAPSLGTPDYDWVEPSYAMDRLVQRFVSSEISEALTVSTVGKWYGDFLGHCPFEDDEIYVWFKTDELIDETRKNGVSTKAESGLFALLRSFMQKNAIAEAELVLWEWVNHG